MCLNCPNPFCEHCIFCVVNILPLSKGTFSHLFEKIDTFSHLLVIYYVLFYKSLHMLVFHPIYFLNHLRTFSSLSLFPFFLFLISVSISIHILRSERPRADDQ